MLNGVDNFTGDSPGMREDVYNENLIDNSKPREERDYKEIYPDLKETKQLKVFVQTDNVDDKKYDNKYLIPGMKNPQYSLRRKLKDEHKNIKFSRKIINDYGFQDPSAVLSKQPSEFLIRPFSLAKNETIQNLMKKKKNQVEYDMDEQDWVYLSTRNQQPETYIKISPEVFEIMITQLENEWDNLERQMSTILSSEDDGNKMLILDEGMEYKYGSDDGVVVGSAEEQRCAVCNDSECDNSNAIVFCDGCDIAVHQECYGIAFIPEGQWLCRKCMISKNRIVDCVFCPSKTGAFKQLDNSLWGHVVCGLWINETYFANPIYLEPIEGLDSIPKSRWKLTCYICKQKIGACIQCCNRNCFQAYHVTCAKRACLYMNYTKGIQGALLDKSTLRSYCDKHGPPEWDRENCLMCINKTRLYYTDMKKLHERNDKLARTQQTANKFNIFKWKTEKNTPIAPKLFSDKLFQLLISLNVEDHQNINPSQLALLKDLGYKPQRSKQQLWDEMRQICDEVCRYWCLKREDKNGAPLIRKNNDLMSTSSIVYGSNDPEELSRKIEIANILIEDIDRVIGLTSQTVQRQVYQDAILQAEFEIVDRFYFPLKVILQDFTQALEKLDHNRILFHYKPKTSQEITWSTIKLRIATYHYTCLDQFVADIEELRLTIALQNKASNNITKLINKVHRRLSDALPSLRTIEQRICVDSPSHTIKAPFVNINGLNAYLTEYCPAQQLALEDLSEVDELSENDNRLLLNFLNSS